MLKTVIVIVILLSTLGLFGGVLVDALLLVVNAISDSFQMFGYVNQVLGMIWNEFPTLLKTMVIASISLVFISILIKVNVPIYIANTKARSSEIKKQNVESLKGKSGKVKLNFKQFKKGGSK